MFRRTEIPETFYSFDTKHPFTECLECKRNLLDPPLPYFIEKAFRKYPGFDVHDVIYEFAMCVNCAEEMRQSLSKESTAALQQYMTNMQQQQSSDMSTASDLERCMITQEPIAAQEEYIIYGVFQGNEMMVAEFPYAIGMEAMNQLSDLLSNETLDIMDDFMGKHFTGPPEVNEWLKPRRPVLF